MTASLTAADEGKTASSGATDEGKTASPTAADEGKTASPTAADGGKTASSGEADEGKTSAEKSITEESIAEISTASDNSAAEASITTEYVIPEVNTATVEVLENDVKSSDTPANLQKLSDVSDGVNENTLNDSSKDASEEGTVHRLNDEVAESVLEKITNSYDEKSGTFKDTTTGKLLSLEEAFEQNVIDPNAMIVDTISGSQISTREAINQGIIDINTGSYVDHKTGSKFKIGEAVAKGLLAVLAAPVALPLAAGIAAVRAVKDATGKVQNKDDVNRSAIKSASNEENADVFNKETPELQSITTYISGQSTIPKISTAAQSLTSIKNSPNLLTELTEMIDKLTIQQAVITGSYHPDTCRFTVAATGDVLTVLEAIEKEYLDTKSTIVRNPESNQFITFDEASNLHVLDLTRGVMNVKNDELNFNDAFQQTFMFECHPPMSLNLIIDILYNENSGKLLNPRTGQWITLTEMCSLNYIDPDSATVKCYTKEDCVNVNIIEALDLGILDGENALVKNSEDKSVHSLSAGRDMGLIVIREDSLSLQSAIHRYLIDPKTGLFINTKCNSAIPLAVALEEGLVNSNYPCTFDERSECCVSLKETCSAGIIDLTTGMYNDSVKNEFIPLVKALQAGHIVDIENPMALCELIKLGFFNSNNGNLIQPKTSTDLNLQCALRSAVINPTVDIVWDSGRKLFYNLPDAINKGLVDSINNYYKTADNTNLTIKEAVAQKFIISACKVFTLREVIDYEIYSTSKGKFVEPVTQDELTFSKAISSRVMDENKIGYKNPVDGSIKSISSAISSGEINDSENTVCDPRINEFVGVDIAYTKGILLDIASAELLDDASNKHVQEEIPQDNNKEPSNIMTIQEAIDIDRIDPNASFIKKRSSLLFLSVQRALANNQVQGKSFVKFEPEEERKNVLCVLVDDGRKIFVKEPLKFEFAVKDKHIDLDTGLFCDNISNKTMDLITACKDGFLDSSSLMVKDTARLRLLDLEKAGEVGLLVDSNKILNTYDNTLSKLREALGKNLVTPSHAMSLLDAVSYIFDSSTGKMQNPFSNKMMDLQECLDDGLLEGKSTVVKCPSTGNVYDILPALENGVLDGVNGAVVNCSTGTRYVLPVARDRGYLFTAEARVN